MLRQLLLALTFAGMLAAPVMAQEDAAEGEDMFVPIDFQGIAVAQAPEAGLGICFGSSSAETIACAEQKCMTESGLGALDCAANLWCYPHAWVADILMQHREGPHWHEFICGKNDRETIDRQVAVACDEDYLIECSAVRIWDPDGEEVLGLVEGEPAPAQ